jgi:hypothetical protein
MHNRISRHEEEKEKGKKEKKWCISRHEEGKLARSERQRKESRRKRAKVIREEERA